MLDRIIASKVAEVDRRRRLCPLATVRALAEEKSPPRDFLQALKSPRRQPAIIAECKRKSPSKGIIVAEYDPVSLALSYQRGGAAAVSVLTDEPFFGGTIEHLRSVGEELQIPVMRKDFIIDEYQIYEARANGADSFLLIAGVSDAHQLQYFLEIGRDLGMEALVETHSAKDMEIAKRTDAKIMGINNRNLDTMTVDLGWGIQALAALRQTRPDAVFVCESGIRSAEDIKALCSAGYRAFLIGEALAGSPDPEQALVALLDNP